MGMAYCWYQLKNKEKAKLCFQVPVLRDRPGVLLLQLGAEQVSGWGHHTTKVSPKSSYIYLDGARVCVPFSLPRFFLSFAQTPLCLPQPGTRSGRGMLRQVGLRYGMLSVGRANCRRNRPTSMPSTSTGPHRYMGGTGWPLGGTVHLMWDSGFSVLGVLLGLLCIRTCVAHHASQASFSLRWPAPRTQK